jgi:hypothetical protein
LKVQVFNLKPYDLLDAKASVVEAFENAAVTEGLAAVDDVLCFAGCKCGLATLELVGIHAQHTALRVNKLFGRSLLNVYRRAPSTCPEFHHPLPAIERTCNGLGATAKGTLAAKASILTSMPLASKRTSLLLLAITALACSRALFFFFHDPEGSNLLVVTVLALILYTASLIAWRFFPAMTASKKLLVAICTQLLIVAGLYTIA